MSEHEPEFLAEIRNIQMLIGRNVLVFQNVEQLLKVINNYKKGSGTPENILKRKSRIDELSLGRLTDPKVMEKIDTKFNKQDKNNLYINFENLINDQELEKSIKFFNDINDDRNLLIHNFTAKWPLDKVDNREAAKQWLLNQYETIIKHRDILVTSCKLIVEGTNIMNDFYKSEDNIKIVNNYLLENGAVSIQLEYITKY